MEALLHWFGYGLCHQLPERSFFGAGYQVPVCARDTGIFVGFTLAWLLIVFLERGRRPTEPPAALHSVVLVVLIVLMAIDGVTSYAGLRPTTNEIRLITGLMTGYALAAFTVPLLNGQLWRAAGSDRVLAGRWSFTLYLASLPIAWLLVYYVAPWFGLVYPWLVVAAIMVTFIAVNLVIVCLFNEFERRAQTVWDARVPVLLALVLTLVELAGASYLKFWLESVVGVR